MIPKIERRGVNQWTKSQTFNFNASTNIITLKWMNFILLFFEPVVSQDIHICSMRLSGNGHGHVSSQFFFRGEILHLSLLPTSSACPCIRHGFLLHFDTGIQVNRLEVSLLRVLIKISIIFLTTFAYFQFLLKIFWIFIKHLFRYPILIIKIQK